MDFSLSSESSKWQSWGFLSYWAIAKYPHRIRTTDYWIQNLWIFRSFHSLKMTMFEIFCCGYALQVAGLPFFKRLKMTKFVCSSLRHIKRFCSSLQVSFACVVFRSSLQEFGKAKFVASHKNKRMFVVLPVIARRQSRRGNPHAKAKNSAILNVFWIFTQIFKFILKNSAFYIPFKF